MKSLKNVSFIYDWVNFSQTEDFFVPRAITQYNSLNEHQRTSLNFLNVLWLYYISLFIMKSLTIF